MTSRILAGLYVRQMKAGRPGPPSRIWH
ncbi:hypothetical protein CO2235_U950020 [Cupriavidus oxalaticus]|uniref:Uncharacterized protein n=1 Tax=Cupriavidus oxalaticus TaxID=96344 RepID=A0A375FK15_9BURK|nr:hypothetical protein CO2235_U1070005 [Cupriavidus oxalaticus]SPC10547.1 hypothetical protein CO2235_U950020 [Cupriavidus oxalaticus]